MTSFNDMAHNVYVMHSLHIVRTEDPYTISLFLQVVIAGPKTLDKAHMFMLWIIFHVIC
jgi:hypothetical protein